MGVYEAVIGLEVHAELNTDTKIFCGCPTRFGQEPNTQVCPVCLGLPGVLPVLNEAALHKALKAALALNCRVSQWSRFDRKNYFYPDLPKNYQISQYDLPLAEHGYLEIEVDGKRKRVGIKRVHLEEDAGKLLHEDTGGARERFSMVDYNRTGVPLIEIVSEPDIRSPEEAKEYLENLKTILQYIDVSDCKMEEGSLRCDANISLRPAGSTVYGTRTELKNLNSFRAVYRALAFEIKRQAEVLDTGGVVEQETLAWDDARGVTVKLRGKEEAHDYRYFPEPDLTPLRITEEMLSRIKEGMPELPQQRKVRYIQEFGLSTYDATVLTRSKALSDFLDDACRLGAEPKAAANWLMGDILRILNAEDKGIEDTPLSPSHLVEMLSLIDKGVISGKIAKTVLEEMLSTGKPPDTIVREKGLLQISDASALRSVVEQVVKDNPKVVDDYRSGKEKAMGFLVGQVMKHTRGKANPQMVNSILKEVLDR